MHARKMNKWAGMKGLKAKKKARGNWGGIRDKRWEREGLGGMEDVLSFSSVLNNEAVN